MRVGRQLHYGYRRLRGTSASGASATPEQQPVFNGVQSLRAFRVACAHLMLQQSSLDIIEISGGGVNIFFRVTCPVAQIETSSTRG
jgi:GTP cyclohydrolase II